MNFIDEAFLEVRAGNGGAGASSFRREKYIPFGGPDGGDGGKGGDIFFRVNQNKNTLIDFQNKRVFLAKNGRPGAGKNKSGSAAEDLIIDIPKGTVIYDDISGDELLDCCDDDASYLFSDLPPPYFISEWKNTVGASFSASSCDTGGCHGVGDLDVNAGSGPTDPVPHTPLVEGGALEPALSLPPSEVVTQTAPCPLPLPGPVLTSGGVLTSLLTLLRPRHQHRVGPDVQVSPNIVLAPLPAVAVTRAVLAVIASCIVIVVEKLVTALRILRARQEIRGNFAGVQVCTRFFCN